MGVPPCKAGRFSQTSPPGCPFATALSSQLLAMPDVGRVDRHFGGAKVFVAAEVLQCQLGLATWVNPQGDPLILGGHEQKSALVYLDSKLTEIKGGYSFCNTSHMFFEELGFSRQRSTVTKLCQIMPQHGCQTPGWDYQIGHLSKHHSRHKKTWWIDVMFCVFENKHLRSSSYTLTKKGPKRLVWADTGGSFQGSPITMKLQQRDAGKICCWPGYASKFLAHDTHRFWEVGVE